MLFSPQSSWIAVMKVPPTSGGTRKSYTPSTGDSAVPSSPPSAKIVTRAPITSPLSTTVVLPAQSGGFTCAAGTGVLSSTTTGSASALFSLQAPNSS